MHPVIHTAKIFVFIVVVTFALNGLISLVGEAAFGKVLLRETVFQPLLATLIGLIPNCAASVGIAQVFLMGGLSYGSTVAGLCSSAGLGILVLYRENEDIRDTVQVLLLLAAISVTVALAIQSVYG